MSVHLIANNESPYDIYTYVADVAHIKANATVNNQVTIGRIPAGGAVAYAYAYEKTALAGASDITLDVGTTANDPDEFIDAWDADGGTPVCNSGDACVQGAGTTTWKAGWLPVGITASALPILAEWNGTVADLTAGEVVVVVAVINPAKFVS
jgi:hypothetical protein